MPKTTIWIFALGAAAIIGGLVYWKSSDDTAARPRLASRAPAQDHNAHTVAHEWQWQNFDDGDTSDAAKARTADQVPSDVVAIYRILQSVRVDENGRVVPDETMKEALEEGFEELGPNLTAAQMLELQKSIGTGLPGQAGQEASQILENYYRFRVAELEFEGQPPTQSPGDRYEKLVELRRGYLGAETADKLFAVEDVNARHMLDAIAIQTNPNLTDAEKQAQQQALQGKLSDRLLAMGLLKPEEAAAEKVQRLREQGASNADIYSTREQLLNAEGARDLAAADREEAAWQRRFNGFWQARRYVMNAGLDDDERDRQIEQLLEQYFSSEEQERARVTSSDWQTRDGR